LHRANLNTFIKNTFEGSTPIYGSNIQLQNVKGILQIDCLLSDISTLNRKTRFELRPRCFVVLFFKTVLKSHICLATCLF